MSSKRARIGRASLGAGRAAVLVAGLVTIGCQPPSGTIDSGPSSLDAASTDAGVDSASVGSAPIAAALGGSVVSADGVLTVEIPPGALAADTVITIDPVAAADWHERVVASAPLSPVYAIGPEGTAFSEPALFHWRFESTPPGVVEVAGEAPFLVAMARAVDGTAEPHASTQASFGAAALTVESQVMHLSEHWLTRADPSAPDTGRAGGDLGAMRQALLIPWSARDVWIRAVAPISGMLSAHAQVRAGPIRVVSSEGWLFDPGNPDMSSKDFSRPSSSVRETVSLVAGQTWRPMTMPSWECTAPGRGRVRVSLSVYGTDFHWITATDLDLDVECVEREDKPEYTAQVAALGESAIEPLSTPGSASYALEDGAGEHAYRIDVPPGATVRVCVSTTGSAGVMYYPRHSPGYTYTDPAPGCTELTNVDPDLPNSALVVITGTGVATVMVTLVE